MPKAPKEEYTVAKVKEHFRLKATQGHQAKLYRESNAFWVFVYDYFIKGVK